jgi:hypothetical protein
LKLSMASHIISPFGFVVSLCNEYMSSLIAASGVLLSWEWGP